MRRFAKEEAGTDKAILDYSCQEEGMVGLGCGARSYTREVHYASRYGVSRKATESIIADYVSAERYDTADYGIVLSLAEQKRRFILKAILHSEGLRLADYSERFSTSLWDDYPELGLLLESGLGELQYEDRSVELLEDQHGDQGVTQNDARDTIQDDEHRDAQRGDQNDILRLTPEGLGYSDSIGDWFISGDIRERMEGFILP
ncbi:coproporphyrinogen III oxidase [compost metagenome]